MLVHLTKSDIRKMNERTVESVRAALDSQYNWASLSNVLSNVLALHREPAGASRYAHCQALWHGQAHDLEERCPQPRCPDPDDWFIEGEEEAEWTAWREKLKEGRIRH